MLSRARRWYGGLRRDRSLRFLLKARQRSAYQPPPATGVFSDVPVSHPFARWIEQLAAENITAGCGGGKYCPESPNTRGQMAVFLVWVRAAVTRCEASRVRR